jgi:hypothetical protein
MHRFLDFRLIYICKQVIKAYIYNFYVNKYRIMIRTAAVRDSGLLCSEKVALHCIYFAGNEAEVPLFAPSESG